MIQERIKKFYGPIKLPKIFEEEDRGFFKCCVPMKVLANGSSNTWENDVTSAWIKLSALTDSHSFELLRDGQATTYVPNSIAFVNEPNAFYTTIPWADVLASDGIGCYSLVVNANISGIPFSFTWGIYNLQVFSIPNALETARIRCFFNMNQQFDGINFTDSNVEDCIRFHGQIDKDQPNSEYENLIYQSRRKEAVVYENLPTFLIETDPYTDEILKKFETLYFLSANEMFISDYNAHSNSYEIQDVPVTMLNGESPEREKIDRYSREVVLTCKVGLRTLTQRSFY